MRRFLFQVCPLFFLTTSCVSAQVEFEVSTFAGSSTGSSVDGLGTAATFNWPQGISLDINGNLVVVEVLSGRVRSITLDGQVSTLAGGGSGSADGQGTLGGIQTARDVIVSRSSGNMFITDYWGYRIRKLNPAGYLSTFAGQGTASAVDGLGTQATFNNPFGLAIDKNDTIYVTEVTSKLLRKITPDGRVTTLAGGAASPVDGKGTAAGFCGPRGITCDDDGNIYILDCNFLRKVSIDGVVSTIAGNTTAGSVDGQGTRAQFNSPQFIAKGTMGNFFISDHFSMKIRVYNMYSGNVSTFAGTGVASVIDGNGTVAAFTSPLGITFDKLGAMYVAEYNNRIRKIVCKTKCQPGFVTTAMAACRCFPCEVGFYQPNTAQSSCIACPLFSACNSSGMSSFLCNPGYASNGTNCTKCRIGSYQPFSGQSSCINCPKNSTCNDIGMTDFICDLPFVKGNGVCEIAPGVTSTATSSSSNMPSSSKVPASTTNSSSSSNMPSSLKAPPASTTISSSASVPSPSKVPASATPSSMAGIESSYSKETTMKYSQPTVKNEKALPAAESFAATIWFRTVLGVGGFALLTIIGFLVGFLWPSHDENLSFYKVAVNKPLTTVSLPMTSIYRQASIRGTGTVVRRSQLGQNAPRNHRKSVPSHAS